MALDQNLKCAHCNTPIVDKSSMVSRGNQAFCCRNCELAMGQSGGQGSTPRQ